MDELTKYLNVQGGQGDYLQPWEFIFAFAICLGCVYSISLVYRVTHRGSSYSQSFVQTLVVMGLVTTLIMIVIGSNIARAFSLVGALSIIRFRNAIKETRDIGFIFFAMAVAMACGTRFYMLAILATAAIDSVLVLMHVANFGTSKVAPERLLTVHMPAGIDGETLLEPTLRRLFDAYSLVTMESIRNGLYTALVYSVRPKPNTTGANVLNEVSKVNDNLKVIFSFGAHVDEL
jgi:hypothetical protein